MTPSTPLSRTPSSTTAITNRQTHIAFIDALRGVAILAVFAYHALQLIFGVPVLRWKGFFPDPAIPKPFLVLLPLTGYGLGGVAMFFSISGFCIHYARLKSKETGYKGFYLRRFFRIYPAYLATTLVFFLCFKSHLFIFHGHETYDLVIHLLALHNLNPSTFFTISGAFWSIAVEIQLYIIYPLLVFFVRKRGWRFSLVLCALIELSSRIMISFYNCSGRPYPSLQFGCPFTYWFSWALGACLADAYFTGSNLPFAEMNAWPVLGAATFFSFCLPLEPFAFPLFSLATTIVMARYLSGRLIVSGRPAQFLLKRLAGIGLISYSFYLIHHLT